MKFSKLVRSVWFMAGACGCFLCIFVAINVIWFLYSIGRAIAYVSSIFSNVFKLRVVLPRVSWPHRWPKVVTFFSKISLIV